MDKKTLKFTGGGGFLFWFGLPFLLAGLFVLAAGMFGLMKMENGASVPLPYILLLGVPFALLGAGLSFGRSGTTLDSQKRTVSTWWGLMVPFKSKHYSWEQFQWVQIEKKVIRSQKSTTTVYPVTLMGSEGAKLTIKSPGSPLGGRRLAERVAKFMGLGTKDSSRGTEVVRQAGTLDQTVRERLLARSEKIELAAAPAQAKSQLDISESGASFDIPAPDLGVFVRLVWIAVVPLVFALGLFLIVPTLAMVKQGGSLVVFAGIWVLAILAGFVSLGLKLREVIAQLCSSHKLTIDKSSIALTSIHKFGNHQKIIPLNQLEELEIAGANSGSHSVLHAQQIYALSDEEYLSFGRGLDTDELTWIKATLEYIMCKA